jgi:hypothetical protein
MDHLGSATLSLSFARARVLVAKPTNRHLVSPRLAGALISKRHAFLARFRGLLVPDLSIVGSEAL